MAVFRNNKTLPSKTPLSKKKNTHNVSTQADKTRHFSSEIQLFVQQIESLSQSYKMTVETVMKAFKSEFIKFDQFIKDKGVITIGKNESKSYKIKTEDLGLFKHQLKDFTSYALAAKNVPSIFFCALVHRYDAYLGGLLRSSFYAKPELLNTSQKQLSFSELVEFQTIDAAREFIVEKEIETVIRDSHIVHFEWMEKRFGVSLRKDLTVWPIFVELTERRNLFVHCDGVVSSQYLSVCQNNGVKFESPVKIGDKLEVTSAYFEKATESILEIGVKLGHVLWRKLQPDDLSKADNSLHRITYDLLCEERYSLAKILLNFAVNTLKKQPSEENRRMNLINLAIAYAYSGEQLKSLEILQNEDWSACQDQFKLAVAVLKHDYTEAVKLMKHIGAEGEISKAEYSSWPLFKEFRKSKEFLDAYKKLFGKEFIFSKTLQDNISKEQPKPKKTHSTRRLPLRSR